ncbi:hypothetical protein NH340_JMT01772 [Sarcoptes scabiei]|nr:hypothetical protein NH340_JMT01772 [Sarcoptes scabiei]
MIIDESQSKPLLSLNRRWKRLPKFLQIYLTLIVVFFVLTFVYYFFMISANKPIVFENVENRNNEGFEADFLFPKGKSAKLAKQLERIHSASTDHQFSVDLDKSLGHDKFLILNEFLNASRSQTIRQQAIQDAILHSWRGYVKYAWGNDFLKPITKKSNNWFKIGLTILDSLDTLIIAGLVPEFNKALKWIENDLSFEVDRSVNCFETTIRAFAGLLSAYHLSKEKVLLEKANDLGNRLIHCFDSPSKIPYSDVNLKTSTATTPKWSTDSSLSEVSSMQLEFRDLSYEIHNQSFEAITFATSKHIHELVKARNDFLLPMYISPISGQITPSTITLGARADSYYEYLYKQYAQTGIEFLLDDYIKSIEAIKSKLLGTTKGKLKLVYIGEILTNDPHNLNPKMDHLVCFLSGTLALSYYHGFNLSRAENNRTYIEHLELAEDLARTCYHMYNLTETGLAPEIGYFDQKDFEFFIKPRDTHNLLRPEFIESLFFLYHITKKPQYREWGWQVFLSFEKYSRIETGGYTTIGDVRHPQSIKPRDFMESFWIAETLKYFYLLFMDNEIIINKVLNSYVFNTEGHLLPRRI